MNKLKIKTILYLLIGIATTLSVTYMYISYKQIKESTLKALNTESINRAYAVTKQMSALNDKMAWEYNKYNQDMYEALRYAQNYFQKNGQNASLKQLKKELANKKDDISYDIYLINSDYIIYKTTFGPDLNLDFHLIPEALKTITKTFNDPNYIDLSSAINDAVTNTYKKYILQKAKNQNYLIQISINIKNKQNIKNLLDKASKNIPNLLRTDIYMLYLNGIGSIDIGTFYSSDYKEGSKNQHLVKSSLYDDFNTILKEKKKLNKHNFKKYINKFVENEEYKDIYFNQDGKYVHQVLMPFYSYLNTKENTIYIISIELDESEAKQTIAKMNIITFVIWSVLFILAISSFIIINKRVIKPIEKLQLKMKAKKAIDTKELVNNHDEIYSMSLIYNQLLQDLNREILSNEELLEEFKNFTANTIHQVRTPISVIKIALEMIKTTNEDAILQIKASLISIEHMYDSLSYALHHEHIKFTKQKLNLCELVKQRLKLFSTIAKAYDLDIQSSIEENLYVNMNQTEAEYLIDNNLSNAIKYGDTQKEIIVKLHKIESEICLSFESYGKAIEDTQIIFDRYHRVDKDRQGNGIGLHMVYNICKNDNIFIKVDYIDGKNKFLYFFDIDVT
jgi:signal transduction histidine kinase